MRKVIVFAVFIIAVSSAAFAETPSEPQGQRGDLDYIDSWLEFDFQTCVAQAGPRFAGECMDATIASCNEDYFYRFCNNNAGSLSQVWVEKELFDRGI